MASQHCSCSCLSRKGNTGPRHCQRRQYVRHFRYGGVILEHVSIYACTVVDLMEAEKYFSITYSLKFFKTH